MTTSHVQLDAIDGQVLPPIARAAIAEKFGIRARADDSAPWLRTVGACFVTLTQHGSLRGCIGTIEARRPLLDDVRANAVAVAFRDRRFRGLTSAELPRTRIEISVLSPLEEVEFDSESDAWARLHPGADGVLFECCGHRSTYLPKVWEFLPHVADFMASLKVKAGVPADFWDETVRLRRYSVRSWREPEGSNLGTTRSARS